VAAEGEWARAPSMRPMISREFIERERRRRFVVAAAHRTQERGGGGVTVSLLVKRAGTARNTFYDLFSSQEDCLRYGATEAHRRLLAPVRDVEDGTEWVLGVRDAIAGFYGAVAEEPNLAALLLIHSYAVDPAGEHGLRDALEDLRVLFAKGRDAAAEDSGPNSLCDETFAHTTLSVASQALLRGEAEELPGRADEVVPLIASAYINVTEVERILPLR
jgi:AcrR family transcriptional regulator